MIDSAAMRLTEYRRRGHQGDWACDDLARNGVDFPCTIGGDLLLQPVDQ